MKLRNLAAAAGAAILATTAFAAPAPAQEDDERSLQCELLDGYLSDRDLYEEDHELFPTSESELEENIRDRGQDVIGDLLLALPFLEMANDEVAADTAGFALDCGLVNEDPAFGSSTIFGSLENLSS
ncbi:hypothetical protein [Corynebacterium halotolerans]|uniref:hypothetical protein n=1 Tax=Corynebacterium halotolerans TaxID=225326 RepID=UPI003CEA33DE